MTTTKTRLIAQGQQVVRIDCEERQPVPLSAEQALSRWGEQHLPRAAACLLSDYGKGVISTRLSQHFIALARAAGKPVVVDPKGADYGKYRGATVIKPNVHEVERFLKQEIRDDAGLATAGQRLAGYLEGTAVLITRGADGMSLFRDSQPPLHVAAAARKVFDVTGAGDTVVSIRALALAAAADLEPAMHLANLAAGISVGKRGAAAVTLDELRDALVSVVPDT